MFSTYSPERFSSRLWMHSFLQTLRAWLSRGLRNHGFAAVYKPLHIGRSSFQFCEWMNVTITADIRDNVSICIPIHQGHQVCFELPIKGKSTIQAPDQTSKFQASWYDLYDIVCHHCSTDDNSILCFPHAYKSDTHTWWEVEIIVQICVCICRHTPL